MKKIMFLVLLTATATVDAVSLELTLTDCWDDNIQRNIKIEATGQATANMYTVKVYGWLIYRDAGYYCSGSLTDNYKDIDNNHITERDYANGMAIISGKNIIIVYNFGDGSVSGYMTANNRNHVMLLTLNEVTGGYVLQEQASTNYLYGVLNSASSFGVEDIDFDVPANNKIEFTFNP